jgi:hypothetical protein
MTVNVFEQYLEAEAVVNEVERRGALVMLISDSEKGQITYTAAVTFFPHVDDEDFAISYDAYQEEVLFSGKGRRSKKREAKMLLEFNEVIDRLAESIGGKVFWDRPLRPERRG